MTGGAWSVWRRRPEGGRGSELPAISAEVRARYNDVWTARVRLRFSPDLWVVTGRGRRLEVRRHDAHLATMWIIDRELEVTAGEPAGIIVVHLESDEALLADRLCLPDPTKTFLQQATGATYNLTGPGETVAKTLVNRNAGPGALAGRQIPGLSIEPDTARGITYPTVLRYANLLSTVQVIGRDWGPLGFRVATVDVDADTRRFEVYTPPDLSAKVRFSLGLGNLSGLNYSEGAPTVTVSWTEGIVPEVKDPQSGAIITPETPLRWTQTSTEDATLAYGRVAESWSDLGERITSLEDLKTEARKDLADGAATTGLKLTPSDDFDVTGDPASYLGARVTVQVGPVGFTDTLAVVDILREVQLVWDAERGTDTATPVVGSDGTTADALSSALQLGDLNRRLGNLERR